MTKLTDAAFDGDIETMMKLVGTYSKQKNKAVVFAEPLSIAASQGHVEIVQVLVSRP